MFGDHHGVFCSRQETALLEDHWTPDAYCGIVDPQGVGPVQAANEAEERLWRMPLWPEFREQMKGNHADLKNVGGRWGGACTAAAFLSHFVDDHPSWAHLDIAGPAMRKNPKGASGYGVASTFRWLSSLSAPRTAHR